MTNLPTDIDSKLWNGLCRLHKDYNSSTAKISFIGSHTFPTLSLIFRDLKTQNIFLTSDRHMKIGSQMIQIKSNI